MNSSGSRLLDPLGCEGITRMSRRNALHLLNLPILSILILTACRPAAEPVPKPIPEPLLTPTAAEIPRPRSRRPVQGVVIVVLDTLRWDYLGCYGSDRGLTPDLDTLAEESIRFERAYATSAWTRSSIASLLTARYPTACGTLGRADLLSETEVTLAEILGRQGFATHGLSTNVNAGAEFGFSQGFDSFTVPPGRDSYPDGFQMVPAEAVTHAALEWLDGRDAERPFLLFLHYTDPHDPYLPHEEWNDPRFSPGRFDGSRPSLQELDSTPPEELTALDRNRIVDLYSGEVAYCDRWIGALLDGLATRGLGRDETLMVVTADHGEGLWSHGWRGHGADLFEEMIRVPLLVRLPGETGGQSIETPVSLIDLSPTVLAHLGLPQPDSFQGHSWLPLLRGEDRPRALEYIYSELSLGPFDLESLRLDDWKLIKNRGLINEPQSPYQLYDLARDPDEQVDLIGTGHPLERHLIDALWMWNRAIAGTAEPRRPGRLTDLSPETVAAMRGLGYLGPVDEQR